MDFERHATLLFCAKSANVQGEGRREGDEEKMFFNHGIHRMMVSLVLFFGVAVSAVAAESFKFKRIILTSPFLNATMKFKGEKYND